MLNTGYFAVVTCFCEKSNDCAVILRNKYKYLWIVRFDTVHRMVRMYIVLSVNYGNVIWA